MSTPAYLSLIVDGKPVKGFSSVGNLERADTIECLKFNHEVFFPRESSTTAASGTRAHKPVTIIKRVDKSSPLLMQYLVETKECESAQFRFFKPSGSSGAEEEFYKITLGGVYVAKIVPVNDDSMAAHEEQRPFMEEIQFVYKRITWEYTASGDGKGTSFEDILQS